MNTGPEAETRLTPESLSSLSGAAVGPLVPPAPCEREEHEGWVGEGPTACTVLKKGCLRETGRCFKTVRLVNAATVENTLLGP